MSAPAVVSQQVERLVRAVEALLESGSNGSRAAALKIMVDAAAPLLRHADTDPAAAELDAYLIALRDGQVDDEDPATRVAYLAIQIDDGTHQGAVDEPDVEHPPPETFFEGQGLVPSRIGAYVQQLGHLRMGQDGRLHRYVAGVYRGDGDDFARVAVRQLLRDRCRARHFAETSTWLRASYPSVPDRPPEQWLNVRNGLLDWRTGRLSAHAPDVVSTVQLPVEWNPDATCPAVETFLRDVLPADAIEFAYELIGYCCFPGNPLRRAVLLLGPGANGKSTLLRLIGALLGAENVSAVPLQVLAENRFAAAELYGRLANISGDLDARAIRQTDSFKMATGGDPIIAERKYGSAFTFTPFATFLFAANEAPVSSDQSEAWFDRWLVVPLERRFTPAEADPHLEAKLNTPDELAGVLVRAVAGLRRLMDRGRFDQPASVEHAGQAYRSRLDTIRAFIDELCVIHADAWVPRSGLYRSYAEWCKDSGRMALSATSFNDRLRSDLHGQVEERGRKGIRGWSGIGLLATDGHLAQGTLDDA